MIGFLLCKTILPFVFLQEKIQIETARLYKLAGINPLAGTFILPFNLFCTSMPNVFV